MDFDQILDIFCYFLATLGPSLPILCFVRWPVILLLAAGLIGILLVICRYCIAASAPALVFDPYVIFLMLLIIVPLVWLNWPGHREVEEGGEREQYSTLENILGYALFTAAVIGGLLGLYNVYQFLVLNHWTSKQAEAEWEAGMRWEGEVRKWNGTIW